MKDLTTEHKLETVNGTPVSTSKKISECYLVSLPSLKFNMSFKQTFRH